MKCEVNQSENVDKNIYWLYKCTVQDIEYEQLKKMLQMNGFWVTYRMIC